MRNLKSFFATATGVAVLLMFTLFSSSCKKKGPIPFNPAFAQYISAYTGGQVSTNATVRIRLTDAFADNVEYNVPIKNNWLEFSPSIEGDLVWTDNQSLEFRPKSPLVRGEVYEAKFKLGDLVEVPSELKNFKFNFMVMKQYVNLEVTSIRAYRNDQPEWMQLSGTLTSRDFCDPASFTNVLNADEDGTKLSVSWTHDKDSRLHHFTIDSIFRDQNDHSVNLQWNGKDLNAEQFGNLQQEIPSLNDFKMILSRVIHEPDQFVSLQFSDLLDPNQSLDGLITFDQYSYMTGERYTIDANEIKVYTPYRLRGGQDLTIRQGIKNASGKRLESDENIYLAFEDAKPEVRIDDQNRVILPSTEGLIFPFQAINLSAVDVRVIRIFEKNVPQFLQINELDGDRQVKRVGRTVKRKRVELQSKDGSDLSNWNTFYLQLDEIIKQEPGAIYRIELSFKKAYSLCNCPDSEKNADADLLQTEDLTDKEMSSEEDTPEYGYYDDYYYDEYYDDWDYDYTQQNNPCSESFYKAQSPVAKNIFASDYGIVAKRGSDNSMLVAVTDIRTTAPLSSVEVEVLNYQQQPLAIAKTDQQGIASFQSLNGVPYLVVIKKGTQKGYLKVEENRALSLSTFDTGGEPSQKGLKGFIYGERGVWRPGDSLFISFILQDEKQLLPAVHPVHFELINPRGQVVQKLIKSKGQNGFFNFSTATSPDAETGSYHANVRVGSAVFTKWFRVETIKPNRLKLNLDFGKNNLTALDRDVKGTLEVKWLHGAVAKNLKANVTANFSPITTTFDQFKNYVFDDPVRILATEEKVIFDGKINSEGKAMVGIQADLNRRAPGMVNAHFSVKVFEEGGDFSVDRFTIPYAPYKHFVGVSVPANPNSYALDTDKNHTIQVASVDASGKPVSLDSLRWTVYKVNWRWWWERSANDLSNYVGRTSTTPAAQGMIRTSADGKGSFNITVPKADWGRFLIRVEDLRGGHATGQSAYFDWPMSESRASRNNKEGASYLTFSMDKTNYTTGEVCKITFPSSENCRAFVSVENSSGVIETQWVETAKEQTTCSIKTTESMAPNAYVNITLLQPHNQTANDLPIRLYGVMPLFVENPNSHLEPQISMPDELSPEQSFEVKVSENKGRAMTYTIAIVDDGLLDLTRFKTPNPWNHFYAREALGVNTFDMYDQVIGAHGSKIEKLLSLGGDGEGDGKAKNRANRFKPVVMYAGPFTIEKGKTQSHKFTMPNYIGSVRVMVVAGKDMAYGNTEKTVPVKRPLMVLATLPRVMGPGERLNLPVTVFAMDQKVKEVSVKVESNDLLQFSEGNTRTLSFKTTGDQVINFPVVVADKMGVAKVKVTVSGAGLSSTYDLEVDVRNANQPETTVQETLVDGGKQWSTVFDLNGIIGSNSAFVEVSSIPAIDFGRRLKFLMEYPHGCVEQTTSAAFPQLYLSQVMELGTAEKNKITENIKAAITRLVSFQTRGGGMAYWPGGSDADEWGSSYSGHFMLEAQKQGYTLPSNWLNSWLDYQRRLAQNWGPQDAKSGNYYWQENDLMQAYRLYTLALAGKPELGAMNRMKERNYLSNAGRWRLAAAYALAGRPDDAKALINNQPTKSQPYTSLSYSYGSNWRDDAMIIETLVLLNMRAQAAPLIKDLATQLSSNNWYSTQTIAYGLIAYAGFAKGEAGKTINFKYTYNGKESAGITSSLPVSRQQLSVSQIKGNKLEVKNLGSTLLYVRLITAGQPKEGNETAAANNLKLDVKYLDINGKVLNVSRIEQGTDFIAEVTIHNPGIRGRLDELALTQIFPSGWEILNNRMDPSAAVNTGDAPDYMDIRDDRVYSYFDLSQNRSKRFRVRLNASYIGRFYLPGASCEAMYDNTIFARTTGQWVEVVAPGNAIAAR